MDYMQEASQVERYDSTQSKCFVKTVGVQRSTQQSKKKKSTKYISDSNMTF